MDATYAQIDISPATRAVFREVGLVLAEAGLLDVALDPPAREAALFQDILRASTAVPLRFRWRPLAQAPVRVWRVRRALRPYRARIREALPLPVHNDPWIESDEIVRRLLHGL